MADTPKTPEDRQQALMNALAESVVDATDEEIIEDVREQGDDPSRRAADIRDTLLKAVGDFEARRAPAPAREPDRPGLFAALAAWLARPAPRFVLATLALAGVVALGVLLWPDTPKAPEIADVPPAPTPAPTPVPPTIPSVPPTPEPVPTPPQPNPNGKRPTPEPRFDYYPEVRTPAPPGVKLEDIKVVCVDFNEELENPGPAITALRDAIAAEVATSGVFTVGDRNTADARVALNQLSPSKLQIELVANGRTILKKGVPATGSAATHAKHVVAAIVERVKGQR